MIYSLFSLVCVFFHQWHWTVSDIFVLYQGCKLSLMHPLWNILIPSHIGRARCAVWTSTMWIYTLFFTCFALHTSAVCLFALCHLFIHEKMWELVIIYLISSFGGWPKANLINNIIYMFYLIPVYCPWKNWLRLNVLFNLFFLIK